jgi:hypothetical protein
MISIIFVVETIISKLKIVTIMNSLKSLLLVACAFALMVACKNDAGKGAAVETVATASSAQEALPPSADNPAEVVPVGPLTSITYPETEFDFGEIEEGEKVNHEFKFKNTGKEPLVISKAQGSCGCTVPDWPREPIPVGGEAIIKVQYDSRGKGKSKAEGGRAENKRVTITANTDPVNTYLYIKGTVYKTDAPES